MLIPAACSLFLPPPDLLQVQPDELFMGADEFRAKFLQPITAGQKHDAMPKERRTMARKLSVLQDRTAVRPPLLLAWIRPYCLFC
jgi:hypothetical protein